VNETSGSTGDERGPPSSALDERVTRALARADATDEATADALRGSEAGRSGVVTGDAGARAFAGLALLVAIAGVAMGVWNYLRPNVKPPDLSSVQTEIRTAGTALQDARASMARLDGQLADMRRRVDDLASTQGASKGEMDTLRNQVMETAEAMQGLAVSESADSRRWMRAEAEHLMQAANIALQLNHDAHTALVALEAADKRLAELDDPALTAARARLTDEIAALRALQPPDLEGVALTLGSLAARVEMLPLAGASAGQASAPSAATQSAWQRALDRIGAAFASMVSVRRTDATDAALLAPEERFFLYRNLELELESARLAALQGDAANYRQSLASARRWLETRFDRNDPGVQSALDALAELEAVEFVASWPDISGSLTELRRAAAE
jgi:uroporphyrin-3 C-methyltransferase